MSGEEGKSPMPSPNRPRSERFERADHTEIFRYLETESGLAA